MILFVVEGTDREVVIFNKISSIFFSGKNKIVTLPVPADMNIYMLYTLLRKDDFNTDVVELLKENSEIAKEKLKDCSRDDFSELYFFFDFDEQGNNIPEKYHISNQEALKEMLSVFNNETENGKLYISYPMIEALRDFDPNSCHTISGSCFCNRIEFALYKESSASNTDNNNFNKYTFEKWKDLANNYIKRFACLYQTNDFDRNKYLQVVNPNSIFDRIAILYNNKLNVFVLSAVPEFLLDYSEKFWNSLIGKRKHHEVDQSCIQKSEQEDVL